VATDGLVPGLVLVLDVDLETAARRLDRPLDKLENRGGDYRRRLREGYLHEAAAAPETIRVIDATATPDEVAARIRQAVSDRFPELA
jgi:dTMP kinase